MKLSRHAKNRCRLYGITHDEIKKVFKNGRVIRKDNKGNMVMKLDQIALVVKKENKLVITTWRTK